MQRRWGRGQAELPVGDRAFNSICAKMRAVVENPFAWIKNMGRRRARCQGLLRNGMDFAFAEMACNWKGSFSLASAGVACNRPPAPPAR